MGCPAPTIPLGHDSHEQSRRSATRVRTVSGHTNYRRVHPRGSRMKWRLLRVASIDSSKYRPARPLFPGGPRFHSLHSNTLVAGPPSLMPDPNRPCNPSFCIMGCDCSRMTPHGFRVAGWFPLCLIKAKCPFYADGKKHPQGTNEAAWRLWPAFVGSNHIVALAPGPDATAAAMQAFLPVHTW